MRKLGILLPLLLVCVALPGLAEERYKKWIFEFTFGGYDPADEVRSDAGNTSVFTKSDGTVIVTPDPRPDRLTDDVMQLSSSSRIDFRAGYGIAEWGWGELILDGGAGYMSGEIRGFEIAYQNCGEAADIVLCLNKKDTMPPESLGWRTDGVNVGEVEQIPVSVNAMVRFRPTKRMNPYGGIGVGYLFVEFREAEPFTKIAEFLDASRGQSYKFSGGGLTLGPEKDVPRPTVTAPDTFFYEARLGIEWQVSPKWSLYTDMRYEWADDSIEVKIGDEFKLGKSTPSGNLNFQYLPLGTPFEMTVPGPNGPKSYGQYPDSISNWYVNGGELDYGGFSWGFGARVSF